jgi:hypothetical protein
MFIATFLRLTEFPPLIRGSSACIVSNRFEAFLWFPAYSAVSTVKIPQTVRKYRGQAVYEAVVIGESRIFEIGGAPPIYCESSKQGVDSLQSKVTGRQ